MGLLDTDDGNVKQEGCKGQEKVKTAWAITYVYAISILYMFIISRWFIKKVKGHLQTWCSQT